MADKTKIQWTASTWNPIRSRNLKTGAVGWFCTHESDGCKFCYAEKMNLWRGSGLAYKPGHLKDQELFLDPKTLAQPTGWGAPRKIFPCWTSTCSGADQISIRHTCQRLGFNTFPQV